MNKSLFTTISEILISPVYFQIGFTVWNSADQKMDKNQAFPDQCWAELKNLKISDWIHNSLLLILLYFRHP